MDKQISLHYLYYEQSKHEEPKKHEHETDYCHFTYYTLDLYLSEAYHRLDGPAYIKTYMNSEVKVELYFIYGISYTKSDYYRHPLVVELAINKLINKELI
jgi:hypothetical protein